MNYSTFSISINSSCVKEVMNKIAEASGNYDEWDFGEHLMLTEDIIAWSTYIEDLKEIAREYPFTSIIIYREGSGGYAGYSDSEVNYFKGSYYVEDTGAIITPFDKLLKRKEIPHEVLEEIIRASGDLM